MKNTVRFKTNKPSGKWAWTYNPSYDVIINGSNVGTILHKSIHDRTERLEIGVGFRVVKNDISEDGNFNCIWKTVFLKARFETVDEMKDFISKHLDGIVLMRLYDVNKEKEIIVYKHSINE
jgi:hypothetical protein